MFRLEDSLDEAEAMADESADDMQVGKNGWVTARFSATRPLGTRVWKRWLKESNALAVGS